MRTATFLLLSTFLFLLTACQKETPIVTEPLPNYVKMDWNGTSIEHITKSSGSNSASASYNANLAVFDNNQPNIFSVSFYLKDKKLNHTDLQALIGEKISLEDCGTTCLKAIISYSNEGKDFHSSNIASNPFPAKYLTITSVTSHNYYPDINYYHVEGEFEAEFTHVDNATQVLTTASAKNGTFRLAFTE